MASPIKRQKNAAIYLRVTDESHGLIALYREPDTCNRSTEWVAEVFVNGGSIVIVRGFDRDATLLRAANSLLDEQNRREEECAL